MVEKLQAAAVPAEGEEGSPDPSKGIGVISTKANVPMAFMKVLVNMFICADPSDQADYRFGSRH